MFDIGLVVFVDACLDVIFERYFASGVCSWVVDSLF